jgi:PAS domain S-box-containing protein
MEVKQEGLKRLLSSLGSARVFESLAELYGDAAIFVVDENRDVVLWNTKAEQLLGFSSEEVLGEYCLKAHRCHACMIGCGLEQHKTLNQIPLLLHRSDGGLVKVRKSGRAFFDEEGNFQGGIEILIPDQESPESEASLLENSEGVVNFHGLLTRDPQMLRALEIVRNVAPSDVTVLVRGESGTGKELIARSLHYESPRSSGPFVAINCAALPESLLESELFGYKKGAFSGAVQDHKGLFERADGGTLFLDEIAELPINLQAKLLRVLQEQCFTPIGGHHQIQVDVRIVAATHRSLREQVELGQFRQDLMFRLRVVPIFLPPLKERRYDLDLLLWHFLHERNKNSPRTIREVDPEAMRLFRQYQWPGNVRELRNVVDYAFAVGRGDQMSPNDLPPEFREMNARSSSSPQNASGTSPMATAPPPSSSRLEREEYLDRRLWEEREKERIIEALNQTRGHVGRAAAMLGMSRPTFWRKRKKYGLE